MSGHRCDPSQDPADTPISQLRALRLAAAMLVDPNGPAARTAHEAIVGCPKCLHEVVNIIAGLLAAFTGDNKAEFLMSFEMMIAELERRTGWGSDG